MRIAIFHKNEKVDSISFALRLALEEGVEMQLIEALESFDNELSKHNYTINIAFSEGYQSVKIYYTGLPQDLKKIVDECTTKVFRVKSPLLVDV